MTIHTREIGKVNPAAGNTVVHLRDRLHLHGVDHLPAAIEQSRRTPVRSPVLVARDSTLRWKAGERLNHAFEQVCVRFGDNEAFFQAHAEVIGEKPGQHQEMNLFFEGGTWASPPVTVS